MSRGYNSLFFYLSGALNNFNIRYDILINKSQGGDTNMFVDLYLKHNVPTIIAVKLAFMHLYKQIQLGIADPEQVEEMMYNIMNNEELYSEFRKDDLMWRRLLSFEKYINKFTSY
jgi:hypothetical protein